MRNSGTKATQARKEKPGCGKVSISRRAESRERKNHPAPVVKNGGSVDLFRIGELCMEDRQRGTVMRGQPILFFDIAFRSFPGLK